jgi:hypothetical protein
MACRVLCRWMATVVSYGIGTVEWSIIEGVFLIGGMLPHVPLAEKQIA